MKPAIYPELRKEVAQMNERPPARRVIAVAGGTGLVGSTLVALLRAAGQEVLVLSRSHGIDVTEGTDLARVLRGVEVVVDTTSTPETDPSAASAFFEAGTSNLLKAGQTVGVRHHIVLSIVGVDRISGNAHYVGKRAQERLVREGPLPWTVLRATQFFEFPEMVMRWTRHGTRVSVAPLLVQPIAARDVATSLLSIAEGAPAQGILEVAGPEKRDFVDMARRILAARRDKTTQIQPSWDGPLSPDMAGDVLLPGPDVAIGRTSFEDWLADLPAAAQ
jgi:uncharacterized protein YbjT (DUF2867 family)